MDKKALSLPILTSIEISNMVGTGIYILPAALAAYGTLSILSWVYTSIGAMFIALTFTHLNRRFPKTGGPYVFCREAFGNLGGFVIGSTYWFTNLASTAGVTVASVGYLGFLSPMLDANTAQYNPYVALGLELSLVWLFTLINIIGVHTAGVTQLILTILKIAPLALVIMLGLGHVQLSHLMHFNTSQYSNFHVIGAAATLTFWAFIGIEAATVPAENTLGAKEIYKATIYGTLITSLIYIVSSLILMGMIAPEQLANSQFPFAEAGKILFGQHGATFIVICGFISGVGTLNAVVLLQSQVIFALARDGMLPRQFARLSKHDVSISGQLLGAIVVSAALVLTIEPTILKQFDTIALLASLLALITYFSSALAELKFTLKTKRKLHTILFSQSFWIAALALIYTMWMIANFTLNMMISALVLMTVCISFFLYRQI